jgi:hypothetical protein
MEISIDEKQALSILRVFCLQQYRQKLWRQSRQYLGAKLGRIHHPLVMYERWHDNDRMDKEEWSRFWQEAQTQILKRESKGWLARARNGRDQSASHKSKTMRDMM